VKERRSKRFVPVPAKTKEEVQDWMKQLLPGNGANKTRAFEKLVKYYQAQSDPVCCCRDCPVICIRSDHE